ncbi:hypothetical protein ACIPSE_46355 [Streptomyces sp. NPDC090106]|uniref:hypothetical protein n=1 Tax=Streptomyces sp. NPDC090106 TaxID=3365946 RepID=UPI003827BC1A
MRVTAIPSGHRAKWAVLVFWIGLLVVAGVFSGKFNSLVQNDVGTFLPKKAESTQTIELAKEFTPDLSSAVVVYESDDGTVTADDRALAAADARRFAGLAHVRGPVDGPVTAKDGPWARRPGDRAPSALNSGLLSPAVRGRASRGARRCRHAEWVRD